ncbi:50S ribosomal protein L3 [Patescibacteria group bacterium]|nr:50S ribosomal protein L3 [Patescibacteria group bacterium]
MISQFFVKKGRMSSLFLDNGRRQSVTTCLCPPMTVSAILDSAKEGVSSLQLAYGQKKRADKATAGRLAKAKISQIPKGFVEFDIETDQAPALGSDITIDTVFATGDKIRAKGKSKGRGFAGVIKRHGFHRQGLTRGQSDRTRAPGSIGAQTPGKVIKGKKMPGHFGNSTFTIENLKIISIDSKKNTISIAGPLPGHINSWLTISKMA